MAAYTTINKPTDYFNIVLWAGNNAARSITGVGHAPNFVWIKDRTGTNAHALFDSVRGGGKYLSSVGNGAEINTPSSGYVSSFDSDGFSGVTGSSSYANWNGSGNNYVGWNWKAGGSASSNSNGSITSSVSASTDAGFSIVSYTGTGSAATIGHGLGAVPKMIIVKSLTSTADWRVQHGSLGATKALDLNGTGLVNTQAGNWNNTEPTNSVFSVGTFGATNTNGGTHIAFCFAEKRGYSRFGSYTGNGNADGAFIYTGFKPAFILIKNTTTSSTNWQIYDNKRDGFNVQNDLFRANLNSAEAAVDPIDILSIGFKNRHTASSQNSNNDNYVYMAFAENPIVDSTGKIPATAR